MKIKATQGSVLTRPAILEGISMTQVFNNANQLVLVAVEVDQEGVYVKTADDPDFQAFCAQYGIRAERAAELKLR